jgi:hypothetical protein
VCVFVFEFQIVRSNIRESVGEPRIYDLVVFIGKSKRANENLRKTKQNKTRIRSCFHRRKKITADTERKKLDRAKTSES